MGQQWSGSVGDRTLPEEASAAVSMSLAAHTFGAVHTLMAAGLSFVLRADAGFESVATESEAADKSGASSSARPPAVRARRARASCTRSARSQTSPRRIG